MRIASWNINGLRARLDFIKLWLEDRQPDVVGFQELKIQDADFPHDFFDELGYQVLAHGQKSWNGVAILHRGTATLTQTGLPGEEERGSRLITASIDCPDTAARFEFTTVYCPNGKSLDHDDYQNKLNWYASLLQHWQASGNDDAARVICGDFNIVPEALDSHRGSDGDGRIFHTDKERASLQSLVDTGLIDLYRQQYPEERAFSWWDYRAGSFQRNHGLRIDFIYGNAAIAERLENVVIDRDYRKKKDGMTASDHAPVYADLNFKA